MATTSLESHAAAAREMQEIRMLATSPLLWIRATRKGQKRDTVSEMLREMIELVRKEPACVKEYVPPPRIYLPQFDYYE